ncbi:MAG: M28 family peptidase, partial [Anaerovoracaceae bacterium]
DAAAVNTFLATVAESKIKGVVLTTPTSRSPATALGTAVTVSAYTTSKMMFDIAKENMANIEFIGPFVRNVSNNPSAPGSAFVAAYNTIADPDVIINVTAHPDNVQNSFGASDNNSGATTLVAVAEEFQTVAKYGPSKNKTLATLAKEANVEIRFILVGAEDGGGMIGSRGYIFGTGDTSIASVSDGWTGLTEAERAKSININMDMVNTAWDVGTTLSLDTVPHGTGSPNRSLAPEYNMSNHLVMSALNANKIVDTLAGTTNMRTFSEGSSDHVRFSERYIDSSSFIRVKDLSDEIEPWYHTIADNMSTASKPRQQDAFKLNLNALEYAINNQYTKRVKVAVSTSPKTVSLDSANATRLFKTIDSIDLEVAAADGTKEVLTGFNKTTLSKTYSIDDVSTVRAFANISGKSDYKYGTAAAGKSELFVEDLAPIRILTNIADVSLAAATSTNFFIQATGGKGKLNYQWQQCAAASSTWADIEGATLNKYALGTSKTVADAGMKIRCKVTDSATTPKSIFSVESTINVGTTLAISTTSPTGQPSSATMAAGTPATFTVTESKVSGGTNPYSYQWQKRKADMSWEDIEGAAANAYTTPNAVNADNGAAFRCQIKDSSATPLFINSSTVTITVRDMAITTQPAAQTVKPGEQATYTIVTTGEGLKYTWQVTDGGGLWAVAPLRMLGTGGATVSEDGKTFKTDTNWAETKGEITQARCVVTDSLGNVLNSSAATFTVTNPLKITRAPKNATAMLTGKAYFNVAASGGTEVSKIVYQWQKAPAVPAGSLNASSKPVLIWEDIAGATKSNFSITATKDNANDYYRCIVRDEAKINNTITESDSAQIDLFPASLINFNRNYGTTMTVQQVENPGDIIELDANTFTRTGYSFLGWNTIASGIGGIAYSDKASLVASDMDLFAQWSEIVPASVKITGTLKVKVKKTTQLKATVSPSTALIKTVTWKSSNTKIATVDKNGKVKGIKKGSAKITARTKNGKTSVVTVKVI